MRYTGGSAVLVPLGVHVESPAAILDGNRIMKLWVVASGQAYQVTYDAPKEQYAQNLPAVQEIIKSIKLDNPASCKVGKI
ncbi:MAG TPA: hypothetical protein VIP70_10740 [Nitrososphaeraceae archaeon]